MIAHYITLWVYTFYDRNIHVFLGILRSRQQLLASTLLSESKLFLAYVTNVPIDVRVKNFLAFKIWNYTILWDYSKLSLLLPVLKVL